MGGPGGVVLPQDHLDRNIVFHPETFPKGDRQDEAEASRLGFSSILKAKSPSRPETGSDFIFEGSFEQTRHPG